MTLQFLVNNECWKLEFVDRINHRDDLGECDHDHKRICIRKPQPEKDILDTIIHEVMHTLDPEEIMSEDHFVRPTATNIANVLWDLGYRMTHPPKENLNG